jgi:hypothetical protein
VIYSQHLINNNKGTRLKDKKQKKQKMEVTKQIQVSTNEQLSKVKSKWILQMEWETMFSNMILYP